jgi:hypothetical protein
VSPPRLQYHSTKTEAAARQILRDGLRLPTETAHVATHRYKTPSVSTTDAPEFAAVYHPSGFVIEFTVTTGARYLKRGLQSMRRGESLEAAVDRWLLDAAKVGAVGVYVGEGLQSSVGNQTLDPRILVPVRMFAL